MVLVIIEIGVLVERGTPPISSPRGREPRPKALGWGVLGGKGEEDTLLVFG